MWGEIEDEKYPCTFKAVFEDEMSRFNIQHWDCMIKEK